MACEFCEIVSHRRPADIVFENDRVVIFKDIHPQAQIHLLVCPKKHHPTFLDTPNEEIAYLFKVCRVLAETLGVENGFRLSIHNGPQGGQIIFHLHVHFMSGLTSLEAGKVEMKID
jgi:histidine triad (HIT) family protein